MDEVQNQQREWKVGALGEVREFNAATALYRKYNIRNASLLGKLPNDKFSCDLFRTALYFLQSERQSEKSELVVVVEPWRWAIDRCWQPSCRMGGGRGRACRRQQGWLPLARRRGSSNLVLKLPPL